MPTEAATAQATDEATETTTDVASTDTASGSLVVSPAADGAQRIENTTEGFAITLPAGWDVVDPKAPGVSDAVRERLKNAGFTNVPVNIDALIASGVKLWAFDVEPDQNTEFTTNFTVLPLGSSNVSLDQIEGQAANQIKQGLGVADVQQQRIKLGDGEALQLRYILDPPAEGAPSVATTQYIFDQARGNYVLTFSTSEATQAAYAPVFEQIASSFELTR